MATLEQINAEYQQLSSEVEAGVGQSNIQAIMQKTKNFIGMLLQTATEAWGRINETDKKIGEQENKLANTIVKIGEVEAKVDKTEITQNFVEERLKALEAIQVDQFKKNVEKHFTDLEIRLGHGGDNIVGSVAQLTQRITALESGSAPLPPVPQAINPREFKKGIMEYKSISCLRPFKVKGEFRIWNERLISALDQARPGAKQLLDAFYQAAR